MKLIFGKSTHVEVREVVGTFFVSFNGVVQCTIDCTGHVLDARADRDVYASDPWHTAHDVTLSFHPDSFSIDSLSHKTVHILLHGSSHLVGEQDSSALDHHESPHAKLSAGALDTEQLSHAHAAQPHKHG